MIDKALAARASYIWSWIQCRPEVFDFILFLLPEQPRINHGSQIRVSPGIGDRLHIASQSNVCVNFSLPKKRPSSITILPVLAKILLTEKTLKNGPATARYIRTFKYFCPCPIQDGGRSFGILR